MSEQLINKITFTTNRLPTERRKTLDNPNELLCLLNITPARRSTIGNPENLIKTLRATCSAPNILVNSDLDAKKKNLQTLQNAINKSKQTLLGAKAKLSQYSKIEHSPSKTSATEEFYQAEKEVEEACKAWCTAQREK